MPRDLRAEAKMAIACFAGIVVITMLAWLSNGCGVQDIGGGAGLDLPFFDVVFQCDFAPAAPDEEPPPSIEVCSDMSKRDLEQFVGGTCRPTPRHLGPCLCGELNNAHNGSICSD